MSGKFYLLFVFLIIGGTVSSQGFVIDHNCIDISQVPADKIQDVKSNLRWHYGHTSHGQQLICGLESLEISDPVYDVAIGYSYLPNVDDALGIFDGREGGTYITPFEYWAASSGIQYTRNVLNNNPAINISAFMWCDQLEYYTLSQVQEYLNQMTAFEVEFPDVTFIYFTANTQVEGADGYNRFQNNELIRQYCIDNDKVLYDFADIESWYNGDYSYYIYNGDTVPTEHDAYYGNYSTECGHANELSRVTKAKAVWWMMAKIAGWEDTISVDVKVFLEGPYSEAGMGLSLITLGHLPTIHPYSSTPWNYTGYAPELEVGNTEICDWILLELRDAPTAADANSGTMIDWQVAFIMNDGKIVSLGGLPLQFEINLTDSLFVVVKHRNHLAIMSADPLTEVDNTYSYDFSIGSEMVYGGATGYIEVETGIWAMIAGDANADGEVNLPDKSIDWTMQAGKTGYLSSDFDLNGLVDNQDKNNFWGKNYSRISQVPE